MDLIWQPKRFRTVSAGLLRNTGRFNPEHAAIKSFSQTLGEIGRVICVVLQVALVKYLF